MKTGCIIKLARLTACGKSVAVAMANQTTPLRMYQWISNISATRIAIPHLFPKKVPKLKRAIMAIVQQASEHNE